MVQEDLPFSARTAQMLMAVAEHPVLANAKHVSYLPASWGTLYELSKIDETILIDALAGGVITPEMRRKDVDLLREAPPPPVDEPTETCTVDDLKKLVTAGHQFGTVYADPPWAYGNQATRAATGKHYPTMSMDEICALPIGDLVADDAHLHLWTTNAFLFNAKSVIEAWGFTYKSCFVWVKPQMGIGNYWRVSHEFLLFGIRGSCPFRDHSLMSWASIDRGEHSEKPEPVRLMLEQTSPPPRLELFGRRLAQEWTVWGNEISRAVFDPPLSEVAL
jgi:N6-adenosine-specific RNA methylase IME4